MINQFRNHLVLYQKSIGTIEQRTGDMRRFQDWFGGDVILATHEDLLNYRNDHLHNRADSYVKRIFSTFRVFYTWAQMKKFILVNPAAGLPNIKLKKARSRPIPEDQLWSAYEKGTEVERAIVLLGGTRGLRRFEIAGLHPRMREGKSLRVLGKGSVERLVPLDPATLEALLHLELTQGDDSYYFPGRFGGHLHPSTIYKWVRRLSGWNIHAFRHRTGSVAYRGTKDLRGTQEFLGHATPVVTQIYIDVLYEDLLAISAAAALPSLSSRHNVAGELEAAPPRVVTLDLDNLDREQAKLVMRACLDVLAA